MCIYIYIYIQRYNIYWYMYTEFNIDIVWFVISFTVSSFTARFACNHSISRGQQFVDFEPSIWRRSWLQLRLMYQEKDSSTTMTRPWNLGWNHTNNDLKGCIQIRTYNLWWCFCVPVHVYHNVYIHIYIYIHIYMHVFISGTFSQYGSPLSVGFARIGIYRPAFEHTRHCFFLHDDITGLSLIE